MGNRSNINLVGNTTQGINIGRGAGVFKSKTLGNLMSYKTVTASGSTRIYETDDELIIWSNSGGTGVYNVTNGLTQFADDIKLGGHLTENTEVSGGTTYSMTFDTQSMYMCNLPAKSDETNVLYVGTDGKIAAGVGGGGTGTITGGTNGLSTSGANVILGGALSAATNICAVDGTSLTFTDNRTTKSGMLYGDDYSANYSCLSIPNVGYITGLTSGGSGGFLGVVTKATAEPSDLASNQWVKPEPMSTGCFNYTFDNFLDSGSTAISVNLSLEDVYLRYDEDNTAWIKESYDKPITSGHTWVGGTNNTVCEIPIINEWVSSESLLCYAGQKFAYDTQTIFQIDVGCCVTMPNKIYAEDVELSAVGDTCLFVIPTGKRALLSSVKLIMSQDASPDTFTVSMGNNSCTTPSLSYNNMISDCVVANVLTDEVYEIVPVESNAVACNGGCLGADVYIRVQSAASGTLCANVLVEGHVF